MRMRLLLAAALGFTGLAASAACTWDWLCNGDGQCKHMPVCESVYDIPPPRPEGAQPPAMPPTSLRPSKIPGPSRPSNLTCEHIMRQDKHGRWTWQQACFCTDPDKPRDPATPFSNIVRCDDK